MVRSCVSFDIDRKQMKQVFLKQATHAFDIKWFCVEDCKTIAFAEAKLSSSEAQWADTAITSL